MLVIFVILLCAFLQSVFGIGLIILGLPTLMLLGYGYYDAVSVVIPCSMLISFLQIVKLNPRENNVQKFFWLNTFPWLTIGILLNLFTGISLNIGKGVGIVLILNAAMGLSHRFAEYLKSKFMKYRFQYLAVMGLIHGYTNLGGGLLSLYAGSIGNTKHSIQSIISYNYFFFSLSQLIVLGFYGKLNFSQLTIIGICGSAAVYFIVGKRVFNSIKEGFYKSLIAYLIFFLGIKLLFS